MAVSIDFSGQTVLVTGAGTGLGLAIADAFGHAGAAVALHDRSPDRAIRAAMELSRQGIKCRGFGADVRDAHSVRSMIDRVVSELGAPKVVVANAGIYPNTPLLDMAEEEWDQVLDTNLKGTFLTCQAAAKVMVSTGRGGQLITIASGAANRAIRGWSHYCASKAAVVMLTRAMALELGEHGIRVNSVLPGYIDVPEGGRHLAEEYREAARSASPLGRPGEPEDVARAVLMLASPLSGYISGASIAVDGGASAGSVNIRPT
jgi:NAD(P)-dependent dehydrogenase (short-subunit alcohol dehydrogenase family)